MADGLFHFTPPLSSCSTGNMKMAESFENDMKGSKSLRVKLNIKIDMEKFRTYVDRGREGRGGEGRGGEGGGGDWLK
jgi:hypothetical protein